MIPMQAGKMSATIVLAEKAFASKASANPNAKRVMLKGYDPVAYFKQNKAVHGNSAISSSYHGVTYYFASKSDKISFDRSPAQFAPQYGGYCACTMASRIKALGLNRKISAR